MVSLCTMICIVLCLFFFFKQKTAYEMRISDWSSDVCSSDLRTGVAEDRGSKDVRPPRVNPLHQIEIDDFRRDRLLAALALILGAAFCLGLPFALQAGAEFFLPLNAALVIAIALVPLLVSLDSRGLPYALAPLGRQSGEGEKGG